MARLRRKKAELRIEVGRKHTLIRGLSHILSLLIHLGNCRHPGGCFRLLALISAVQPGDTLTYQATQSHTFCNTYWPIPPSNHRVT